ncbi:MAG: methyltransferase family protein [Candidatus Njordarchaeales archaeon]
MLTGMINYSLFFVGLVLVILVLPFHILSIKHKYLEETFSREKGRKIGEILGYVSGWGFFIGWALVWLSPQPRFLLSPFRIIFKLPILNIATSLLHLVIFAIFFPAGFYFGVAGVKELSLRVSETHRPEKIVTTGVYSIVRHPQYLGGLLAHIGLTFLLSAWYSLLSTPIIIVIIYVMCWAEEKELLREFGKEYEEYRTNVPMFIPRMFRNKKEG